MVDIYFLDTYAIIEIIKNNENFEKFKETANFTGMMNLLEVHYNVTKDYSEKEADLITKKLKNMVIDFNFGDITTASRFRIKHIKKKWSYIDCLSYVMAKERNYKFLTGDKEFKNIPNVEFVK